jgi:hypothetical protein
MKMMIGIVRKLRAVVTGRAFANCSGKENNGMTIYTFSGRDSGNDRSGKGKRLQPISVRVK